MDEKELLGSKAIRLEYIKEPLRVWPVVGCRGHGGTQLSALEVTSS